MGKKRYRRSRPEPKTGRGRVSIDPLRERSGRRACLCPSLAQPSKKVRIVADNDGYFGHPLVRESSVLALSKFMCISEAFCERYLDLLFTTLEKATDTAVSLRTDRLDLSGKG